MFFPPHTLPFLFILLSGTLLSISSSSWFGAWVGLELNLMSFIPLITLKTQPFFSEASLKYFLIQALGSSVIVLASCMVVSNLFISTPMLFMALLLKLGSAPFHFWFPQVTEGLLWPQALLLLTIQKIAPMFLISYLLSSNPIIMILTISAAVLSSMVGALGGFNQMLLRKIMAFSSINHMSWMLIAMTISESLWLMYFSFYSLISSSVIFLFHSFQAFHISHTLQHLNSSPFIFMIMPMSLLSLGGLPPFTGFLPKWMMIQAMASCNMFLPLVFLLASALITLYFYIRIFNMYMIFYSPYMKWTFKYQYSKKEIFSIDFFFNLSGIFFSSFLFLF
uniref:NADH-ubiquinone oxidoreductase chain 2 n=1 Tax=Umalia orientalis TaxID=1603554 RepID=A0A0D3QFT0_9EUCA|nr:NADH dehydrogenase subunit 2 [Umalia orientalis]AJF14605.1 NADH dehydrogenase subunit 2 [Umalia orientalis]